MRRKPPNRRPNVTCDRCGTPMYRRPSRLSAQAGKFCSRACRNSAHPTPTGPCPQRGVPGARNGSWKGGVTHWRKAGNYPPIKYVRCPPAFLEMARRDGYVMEHRLLVARELGRCLTRAEAVHHIDHDPTNNALENLMLFATNRDHKLFEHHGAPAPLWSGAETAADS